MKKLLLMAMLTMSLLAACNSSNKNVDNGTQIVGDSIAVEQVTSSVNCSLDESVDTLCDVQTLQSAWRILCIEGQEVESEETPMMIISVADSMMSTYAGCKVIASKLIIDNSVANSLKFTAPIITMKSCPNDDADMLIIAAIPKVAKFSVNDTCALLKDDDNNIIFSLLKMVQ